MNASEYAERTAAYAAAADMLKSLVDEWAVERTRAERAEALNVRLREALEELGPIVRGLGEHGVQIVLESEAADGARWVGDPAFVTKLKEVIRIFGNGAADIVEKRVAAAIRALGEPNAAQRERS